MSFKFLNIFYLNSLSYLVERVQTGVIMQSKYTGPLPNFALFASYYVHCVSHRGQLLKYTYGCARLHQKLE